MATETFSINLDADLVEATEKLFSELGLDLNTAINIFLRHSLHVQGIPFVISKEISNTDACEGTLHE